MLIGLILFIVVTVTIADGDYIEITELHIKINSDSGIESINSLLPESTTPFLWNDVSIEMRVPVNLNFRLLAIGMMILITSYLTYIMLIIRKIIGSV